MNQTKARFEGPVHLGIIGPDTNGQAPGGMASISSRLARALSELNSIDVTMLSNYAEGSAWWRMDVARRCMREIWRRRHQLDLVHIQVATGLSIERDLLIAFVARACRVGVVCQFHGAGQKEDFKDGSFGHRMAYKALVRLSCSNLVLGSASERWMREISTRTPVARVPNFVHVSATTKEIPDGDPLVAFIGRVGQRKGAYDLLEALSTLSGRGINFRAVFAGDGEVDDLRRKVRERASLAECVEIRGWQSDQEVLDLLTQAWVVVLPSYKEGLPMALLEAMAQGRGIISTNVGDIPDLFGDGEGGLMVEPGDVDGLADAIEAFVLDHAFSVRRGRVARQLVAQSFSQDVVVGELVRSYGSVVSPRVRPRKHLS